MPDFSIRFLSHNGDNCFPSTPSIQLIVFFDEIPFSYLLLDSVLMPAALEDFLIVAGLKTAPSR
jgi:hypothetical protein